MATHASAREHRPETEAFAAAMCNGIHIAQLKTMLKDVLQNMQSDDDSGISELWVPLSKLDLKIDGHNPHGALPSDLMQVLASEEFEIRTETHNGDEVFVRMASHVVENHAKMDENEVSVLSAD